MKPDCDGCGLSFHQGELNKIKKGKEEFVFCDFCRTTFVSNSVMYPSEVTNKQLIKTIAKSHNLIMKELKRKIKNE